MQHWKNATLICCLSAACLTACGPVETQRQLVEPQVTVVPSEAAPENPPGRCWTQLEDRSAADGKTPLWFETPCPADVDKAFIQSLQRALQARGLFDGPVTGTIGPKTRAAVRGYQIELALDSETLSLAAARRLGLAPYEVEVVPGRGQDVAPPEEAEGAT